MQENLSESLETIFGGGRTVEPIVQVLASKICGNRTRLLISDGKHYTSLAVLLEQKKIVRYSAIKVRKYFNISMEFGGESKPVLALVEIETVGEIGGKIGSPVEFPGFSSEAKKSSKAANTSKNVATVHPIESLNPYRVNWGIKAKVADKSRLIYWSKKRKSGKYFSMVLVDESGQIKATAFDSEAERFYKSIRPDKVYYISKCKVKMAGNQLELILTDNCVFEECDDFAETL